MMTPLTEAFGFTFPDQLNLTDCHMSEEFVSTTDLVCKGVDVIPDEDNVAR